MVCLSYSRDHNCCLPAVGMAFMGYTTRFCESFTYDSISLLYFFSRINKCIVFFYGG